MKRRASAEVEDKRESDKRLKADPASSSAATTATTATASLGLDELLNTKISDLVASRKPHGLTVLYHNTTVKEALEELSRHHILSAPVLLNASAEDQEVGTYMG